MAVWQWTQSQGKSYLTCDLLGAWPHGFFTRDFWPLPPEQLNSVLDPQAAVYRIKQVHGNRVLSPEQMHQNGGTANSVRAADEIPRPEADALLSDGKRQALWVCSADCNPVLVGDTKNGQVAAVHAGWRGTALKIVPLTVEKLLAQGSRLEDLVVAIGPAISGEVYQVSFQVACEVVGTINSQENVAETNVIEHVLAIEGSPLLPDPEQGRIRLDVRRVNVLQLERLGLSQEQISVAPQCTFQEPERFFSYRRTREKKVQWSGIVSR